MKYSEETRRVEDENKGSATVPVIEFNPALHLLAELDKSYGHIASFFYDKYGGLVIAVKLKQVRGKTYKSPGVGVDMICIFQSAQIGKFSFWSILEGTE